MSCCCFFRKTPKKDTQELVTEVKEPEDNDSILEGHQNSIDYQSALDYDPIQVPTMHLPTIQSCLQSHVVTDLIAPRDLGRRSYSDEW